MEVIQVKKGLNLKGEIKIDDAKNSALPIIIASLLGTEPIILEDALKLKDISITLRVLEELGSKITYLDKSKVEIDSSNVNNSVTPHELTNKMRASFLVMGSLLTRLGQTKTYLPGGCAIGSRPVDLHLKEFKALGAETESTDEKIEAIVKDGLIGGEIYLDFPSVGVTQNIMMAATMAKGETVTKNAAKEPEIVDLTSFLNKLGVRVRGAGTSTIRIVGVDKLHGAGHTIIPDRIEAATFMVASTITRSDVTVKNCISSHIMPIIAKLHEVDCEVIENEDEDSIRVIATGRLKGAKVKTLPYPGFPINMQAQFMALMTVCKGRSSIEETVFENRFIHAEQLQRIGAAITIERGEVSIAGVNSLQGATVKSTDLGAGAALILAGLVADGTTNVTDIYHIGRGCDDTVSKFKKLGANIEGVEIEN